MLKRRIVALWFAVLMGLGLAVAVQAPASAAPGGCPTGQACMWTGANYTGDRLNLAWSTYQPLFSCHNLDNIYPYTFDTTTSSVYNDYGTPSLRNYKLVLHYGPCGNATPTWNIPGGTGANMSSGSGWDNHVRAFHIAPA